MSEALSVYTVVMIFSSSLCLSGAGTTDVYYHSSIFSFSSSAREQNHRPSVQWCLFVCLSHNLSTLLCLLTVICAIREEVKGVADFCLPQLLLSFWTLVPDWWDCHWAFWAQGPPTVVRALLGNPGLTEEMHCGPALLTIRYCLLGFSCLVLFTEQHCKVRGSRMRDDIQSFPQFST